MNIKPICFLNIPFWLQFTWIVSIDPSRVFLK